MATIQRLPVRERRPSKKVLYTCACGCGAEFLRYPYKINGKRPFLNPSHKGGHESREYLARHCGIFLPLFTSYMRQSVQKRYRSPRSVRSCLPPFFLFLNENGVSDITDVTPERISAFAKWAGEHAKGASRDLSALRTFFFWCIVQGLYRRENPVIPAVHAPVLKKQPQGRPYTDQEISDFRSQLAANGSVRVRAIFELVLESGLRNGEICHLRLSDVDLEAKSIMVDLPNKGMRQRRTMIYSAQCVLALQAWLQVRQPYCEHPGFFHNQVGGPCVPSVLCSEFRRVFERSDLPGTAKQQTAGSFSLHRLRHTFASLLATHGAEANTIQELCGWQSTQTALTYISIEPSALALGYADALGCDPRPASSTVISDEEFMSAVETRV